MCLLSVVPNWASEEFDLSRPLYWAIGENLTQLATLEDVCVIYIYIYIHTYTYIHTHTHIYSIYVHVYYVRIGDACARTRRFESVSNFRQACNRWQHRTWGSVSLTSVVVELSG